MNGVWMGMSGVFNIFLLLSSFLIVDVLFDCTTQ